ncbi:unnamed protein product [Caenorhabditis angaria]|uniref:Uncharacterized protein n=1 Tax=Caenorhabditis angaria TaxID=860376 RepID=A0A9P1IMH4_9PELO|nr:unnamed protein product [Caenorhabditis angaria]
MKQLLYLTTLFVISHQIDLKFELELSCKWQDDYWATVDFYQKTAFYKRDYALYQGANGKNVSLKSNKIEENYGYLEIYAMVSHNCYTHWPKKPLTVYNWMYNNPQQKMAYFYFPKIDASLDDFTLRFKTNLDDYGTF